MNRYHHLFQPNAPNTTSLNAYGGSSNSPKLAKALKKTPAEFFNESIEASFEKPLDAFQTRELFSLYKQQESELLQLTESTNLAIQKSSRNYASEKRDYNMTQIRQPVNKQK